jgi:spore maturation protein SpmA
VGDMVSLKGLVWVFVVVVIVGAIIISSKGIFEAALHSAISSGSTSTAVMIVGILIVFIFLLLYYHLKD